MLKNENIFLRKNILIYGVGKSGLSTYEFLKKQNNLYLFDDNKINIKKSKIRKKFIKYDDLKKIQIDHVIVSPGIDINKCTLKG